MAAVLAWIWLTVVSGGVRYYESGAYRIKQVRSKWTLARGTHPLGEFRTLTKAKDAAEDHGRREAERANLCVPHHARRIKARYCGVCCMTGDLIIPGDWIWHWKSEQNASRSALSARADGNVLAAAHAKQAAKLEHAKLIEDSKRAAELAAMNLTAVREMRERRIEAIRRTGRDPKTNAPVWRHEQASERTLDLLDVRGMRYIKARRSDVCGLTGAPISKGDWIYWDCLLGIRLAELPAEASVDPPRCTIPIGDYSGVFGSDAAPQVGEIRDFDSGGYVVTHVAHQRVWEDGLSFGLPADSGTIYTVWGRELTAEERAREEGRQTADRARGIARADLSDLHRLIESQGHSPDPANGPVEVDGVRCFSSGSLYGGGRWLIVTPTHVWSVRGNGADGDDWSRNNMPGAVGTVVERSVAIEERLRAICSVISPGDDEIPDRRVEESAAVSMVRTVAEQLASLGPDPLTTREFISSWWADGGVEAVRCLQALRAIGCVYISLRLSEVTWCGSRPVSMDSITRRARAEVSRSTYIDSSQFRSCEPPTHTTLIEELAARTLPGDRTEQLPQGYKERLHGVSVVDIGGACIVTHPRNLAIEDLWVSLEGRRGKGPSEWVVPERPQVIAQHLDAMYGHHGEPVLVGTLEAVFDCDEIDKGGVRIAGIDVIQSREGGGFEVDLDRCAVKLETSFIQFSDDGRTIRTPSNPGPTLTANRDSGELTVRIELPMQAAIQAADSLGGAVLELDALLAEQDEEDLEVDALERRYRQWLRDGRPGEQAPQVTA